MRLTIMLTIYAAVFIVGLAILYGPLKRAAYPEGKHGAKVWIPMVILIIAILFPVFGAITPDGPVCWFFQKWGNIFLGYLMYFLGMLLLVMIGALIYGVCYRSKHHEKWKPQRKTTKCMLTALLIITVGLNVGGSFVSHDVKVTNYEISKEVLGQTEPLRIVLIGDLHIGVNSSLKLYEDMVDRVNEQDADLIVVAGDIVTSSFNAMKKPEAYSSVISKMNAKYGKYAVYGNHDVDEPLLGGFTFWDKTRALRNPAMPGFIKDCGWTILNDEVVRLPELNDLVIAGRRDEAKPGEGVMERMTLDELLKGVDPEEPLLLLEHEPYELDIIGEKGVDLSVSGHTHDGQIFPGNVFVRIKDPQSYGIKTWGEAIQVVTSGVGFYGPPIRVGTISEIVVIDLV